MRIFVLSSMDSSNAPEKKNGRHKRRRQEELPLIEDMRLLGRILGDVIRQQEGQESFELIEQIRRLSVAFRRESDQKADRDLKKLLKRLSGDQTVGVIRAFTYFSHLANLAEDRHYIRRRAYHERRGDLQEGSVEVALARLRKAGISPRYISQTLAHSLLSPVLTAHPTEVQRKSVLDAERGIAHLLNVRDAIRARADGRDAENVLTPRELAANEAQLRARVLQLWQTRLLRHTKLTVTDEIDNALSYYEATFLREIPTIYADLERELPGQPVASFLKMGSWIGGDRDGNPNVTAQTLNYALQRQAELVLRHYLTEVHHLGSELSMSMLLTRITPQMQKLADSSPDDNQHRLDEPYRRALTGIYARLAATLQELTGGQAARHALPPQNPYPKPDEFLSDLRTIESSLLAHHAQPLVWQRLHPLIRAVEVFGFHLATVDLRQSSDKHEQVLAELLTVSGLEFHYSDLDENAKRALLLRVLADARPLCVRGAIYSDLTRGELAIFERARQALESFGPKALRHCIISHTESVSDLLEVLTLLKETGLMMGTLPPAARTGPKAAGPSESVLKMIVVPLFETIEDLRQAPTIMRNFTPFLGLPTWCSVAGLNKKSCWVTQTATRTAVSSRATGNSTAPRLP